ncbi:hypothetical protein [Flavivirga jejuensis]|uniref:O-antigen/teichoic acid export membrane protein n=1 Tax=Flavivirga jejuensis TaxID=870487 RepID=A0ABT8WU29_9FLAO|nr:hypothetical protein [Flavivirga jejuensis]MDO5976377.1 hypothetical protein [Flavivirga jejuensis]
MENISKYLKKNFLISTSKTLTVSLVTLLLLPLIIKRVGLELYGIVSLTLLFSGVSSLIDLGLSKAVILLSGENKISENKVVSSALYINLFIISILLIIFIVLQMLSIDILGSDLNLDEQNKFILLNIGFSLLVLMLLNNLCRTILEAKYMIHIVNLTLTIYTPLLYLTIFIISFFTNQIVVYILIPFVLTLLMFLFNLSYIKIKTTIKIVRVNKETIKYVLKRSFAFLNIGLINSMIMPLMRYIFILLVADVGLYALFDLSFKIAMLANSFILSLATPMFAVFSKEIKANSEKMTKVSYKIFYVSIALFLVIIIGYYFFGNYFLHFLNLERNDTNLLYTITFGLILSLGTVAIVEIFYRYFLGNNQLTKAFLLKLIVPVFGIIIFFVLKDLELIYRFIYAYSIGLFISAIAIFFAFVFNNKWKKTVEI